MGLKEVVNMKMLLIGVIKTEIRLKKQYIGQIPKYIFYSKIFSFSDLDEYFTCLIKKTQHATEFCYNCDRQIHHLIIKFYVG